MKKNVFCQTGLDNRTDIMTALHITICTMLFLTAGLFMINDVFCDWRLDIKVWILIVVGVLITTGFYDAVLSHIRSDSLIVKIIIKIFIFILSLLICFIYYRLNYDALNNGFMAMADDYTKLWCKCMKIAYNSKGIGRETIQMAFTFAVILLVVLFLNMALILKKTDIFVLIPLGALVSVMLLDVVPGWTGFALMFTGIVILNAKEWTGALNVLTANNRLNERRKHINIKKLTPLFITAVIATIVLNVTYMAFQKPAGELLKKNIYVKDFQKKLEYYLTGLASDSSDEGLISNREPIYRDKKMLVVTSSQKPEDDVYLRGYVGTDYKNGRWVCNDKSFFEEYSDAGLDEQLVDRIYQREVSGDLYDLMPYDNTDIAYNIMSNDDDMSITYSITDTTHLKKTVYLPYLPNLSDNDSNFGCQADTKITKQSSEIEYNITSWDKTKYFREYINYSKYFIPDKTEVWYRNFVIERYTEKSEISTVADYCNQQSIQENVSNKPRLNYPADLYSNYKNYFNENLRDDITLEDENLSDDMIAEDDLSDYYMLEDKNNIEYITSKKNEWRVEMAELVQKELSKQCEYSLKLTDIPEGEDPIEYFMSDSHKGFCTHFASAGVMMLRQLGVPARYASGYIIKKDTFTEDDDKYTVDVLDRCGHAWAEIYLDGIGWIPAEMTPGYQNCGYILPTQMTQQQIEKLNEDNMGSSMVADSDNEAGLDKLSDEEKTAENNSGNQTQNQQEMHQETDAEDSDSDEDDADNMDDDSDEQANNKKTSDGMGDVYSGTLWDFISNKRGRNISIMVVGALLAIVAGVSLFLRRKSKKESESRLKREIRQRKNRKAIKHINKQIYKKTMRKKKILKRTISDTEYEKILIDTYPFVAVDYWKRYIAILQKTTFSKNDVTTDDAAVVYRIYCEVMGRKR